MLWKWVRKVINFIRSEVSADPTLEGGLSKMLQELKLFTETTSYAMVRADEAFELLQKEIQNHDSLGSQAEEYLVRGDEEAVRRLIQRQLDSASEVSRLKALYEDLQSEAETRAQELVQKKQEVESRRSQLPQLQDDIRMIEADKKLREIFGQYNLSGGRESFDNVARQIEMQRKQGQYNRVLEAGPHAAVDRRIAQTNAAKAVEDAMSQLKQRVLAQQTVTTVINVSSEDDPVAAARKAIEAPRYAGLLIAPREKIGIKREND